jgi:hypothetical protein
MIHIFFCASAAGNFRQLLDSRNVKEEVASISEELDFGPISYADLAEREAWLNRYAPLDFCERDWLATSEARFRKQIANHGDRLIWISPSSAAEQAGLYWYLSQFSGEKTKLAIADYGFGGTWNGNSPLKLGELAIGPMGQLYDECPRVAWNPSRFNESRWSTLVEEDALLRVVTEGALQSAPDDYFDSFLLACCPIEWVKWHRVLADTMGGIWDTRQTAGSDLLLWRLRALIESGQIACEGEPPRFGGSTSDAVKIRRVV